MTNPAVWRIQLLGTFELRRDGQLVVPLEARKPDLLLAYLAIHRERAHSREDLSKLFWPGLPMERRRNRLSEVLHLLKGVVE